jgi:putative transposase
MARKLRGQILYDGCYAHIYSRALEHRNIFCDTVDFEMFKSLLQKTKAKYSYRIYHYCLMNTHFHLLVSIDNIDAFSYAMKELKRRYAYWVHIEQRRYGPIWWGRFGSQLVENEKYLYACGLYIEMNPVTAGLVAKPEEWEYSSSRYYFLGQRDVLIDSYEQPEQEQIANLVGQIDLANGHLIGSELFKICHEENS